jgi:hypothetical protein
MGECFWVEKPGILLSPPSFASSGSKDDHSRRIETFNNITRALIIAAIVLAVLRVKNWWIWLLVGLAIIMFTYYNVSGSCNVEAISKGIDTVNEGYRSTEVSPRITEVSPRITEDTMSRKPSAVTAGYDDETVIMRKERGGTRITTKLDAPRPMANRAYGPPLSAPRIPDEDWAQYVTFADEEMSNNYVRDDPLDDYIPRIAEKEYKQPKDHLEMYRESMEEERAAMKASEDIHESSSGSIMYAS